MSINPNAIVPPHRPAVPYERTRKSRLASWLWIGAFVLFLGACGLGLLLWTNGDRIGCMLTQCDKNPVGMPAPWAEIVAAADEAAQKASPDAMLDAVRASPVASWAKDWSTTKTLEVTFEYKDPNGETLYVDVHDKNPGENVKAWGPAVEPRMRSNRDDFAEGKRDSYERLKADSARRRAALSRVRVSPRQAEVLTWKEGLAEARNDDTQIAPTIYLELGYGPQDEGTVPTWRVKYTPVPSDGPPGLLFIFAQSSAFVVDATTGEIIERETGDSIFSP